MNILRDPGKEKMLTNLMSKIFVDLHIWAMVILMTRLIILMMMTSTESTKFVFEWSGADPSTKVDCQV